MPSKTVETRARTTKDRRLNLRVDVDVVDADVDVVVTVTPVTTGAADENGWPIRFFDRVAGSMPDLRRASQPSETTLTFSSMLAAMAKGDDRLCRCFRTPVFIMADSRLDQHLTSRDVCC